VWFAPYTWRRGAQFNWLSLKTKVDGFLVVWPQNHYDGFSSVWASKPMVTICEWFGLKTTQTVFVGLASKPVVTVSSGLASKSAATIFAGLASKPVAVVSTGLTSKPTATVFSSLASKLVMTVSLGLASKPVVDFLVEPQNQGGGGFPSLGLKNGSWGLLIWASKSSKTVSWFGPQIHVGFGLLVAPQNRRREVGVGHASRSSGLLCM
jgi:hypothetical protein